MRHRPFCSVIWGTSLDFGIGKREFEFVLEAVKKVEFRVQLQIKYQTLLQQTGHVLEEIRGTWVRFDHTYDDLNQGRISSFKLPHPLSSQLQFP